MRLIRCTIDPPINHEARINHLNPARQPDNGASCRPGYAMGTCGEHGAMQT